MIAENEEIEERIIMEVVVDAYDADERAMGWFYYIAEGLDFPFQARCTEKIPTSPLKVGEEVTVVDASSVKGGWGSTLFVDIKYDEDSLSVPLAQLEILDDNPDSKRIIEDWHYWIGRGYEF